MPSMVVLNRGSFEEKKETLQTAVDELKKNVNQLDELRNSTVSVWEGEARDQYDKDMTDGISRFNDLISVIERFVGKMEEVLDTYTGVERKNKELIN